MSSGCVFCKIIHRTIPSVIIKENDHIIVIQDKSPKAPLHYLIITKKHIESLLTISDEDKESCWQLLKMAHELGVATPAQAFNFISNNGAAAGQSVFHLHLHFMSGKNLYENGLKL
jgi:histidine triad (HIT) family protein